MIKALLIFSEFAPLNNCAAIPNTKVVKYLAHEQVEITLIAKEVTEFEKTDITLVPAELQTVRQIRVGQGNLFSKTIGAESRRIEKNGVKRKMKSASKKVKSWAASELINLYFDLRSSDWTRQALKAVKRELSGEHFDVLYSSYPPSEAHLLALKLMKKHFADYWIADFRDPIFYAYFSPNSNDHRAGRLKQEQDRYVKAADRVTIVSEGAKPKFLYDGIDERKIFYLPNGYDPEDFSQDLQNAVPTPEVFRILYAGTLYEGRRDISVLFKAVRELCMEGKADPGKISIEYAGKDWNIMEGFAEKEQMTSNCKNYGFIPHYQVMEILSEVDCSIVCSHNTKIDQGVVTGKVFELLLAAKPIIGIINGDEPNSELGQILRSCKAGVIYEQANGETDYTALKSWLLWAYESKMRLGRVPADLNNEERDKYSYSNIGKTLFQLMLSLKNHKMDE